MGSSISILLFRAVRSQVSELVRQPIAERLVTNVAVGIDEDSSASQVAEHQGNSAKARAAYQDFPTLWTDADPDVPLLKEAKPSMRC
jgi:hypothetical protein